MTHNLRKGQLRFEGTEPMSFVESDEASSVDLSPEQQAATQTLSATIRAYLKSAESLIAGKYNHLENIVPRYLSSPGTVVVAVCPDGVVVRYESKMGEDRRLGVAIMLDSIAHAALVLSQNLVRVQHPSLPNTLDEKLGVEMRLTVVSPSNDTSHDLAVARIWFDVKNKEPEQPHQLPSKPYCLLSVRNRLEIEIHGELGTEADSGVTGQPFIAKSEVRLDAGWECIEVFPGFDINAWRPEYAPLWAETDLLSAALVAQLRDDQHRSLDPRAAARKRYAALLADFRSLLDSDTCPRPDRRLETIP